MHENFLYFLLQAHLLQEAKPGHWLITDQNKKIHSINPETLAVDLVKAACLDFLPDEVPYQIDCKLNYFEDYDGKVVPVQENRIELLCLAT